MKVSRQRALIALRSFPSVAAAARSVRTTPATLLRMTLDDDEIAEAYENCVHGILKQREQEARAAEKRQRKLETPRVTEREAERRKARFFAATGRDPRLAASALHKRLNHERRQERAAELEAAIEAVDSLIQGKELKTPSKAVLDVWDRWCANCKAHRVDDPCEVCSRHTILVKA